MAALIQSPVASPRALVASRFRGPGELWTVALFIFGLLAWVSARVSIRNQYRWVARDLVASIDVIQELAQVLAREALVHAQAEVRSSSTFPAVVGMGRANSRGMRLVAQRDATLDSVPSRVGSHLRASLPAAGWQWPGERSTGTPPVRNVFPLHSSGGRMSACDRRGVAARFFPAGQG